MKERPILFSGEMVRAILAGRKTQTRRVLLDDDIPCDKPQFGFTAFTPPGHISCRGYSDAGYGEWFIRCPYGQPGDLLWVREGFCPRYFDICPDGNATAYRADYDPVKLAGIVPEPKWKPSIHMPRWASRLTLKIVSVRVERLQDISEADAREEGIPCPEHGGKPTASCSASCASFSSEFAGLWDSINAKRAPWSSNPWAWVIEFRRVDEKARAA